MGIAMAEHQGVGAEGARRLRMRDQELFPRLVRRSVLVGLWIVLAVVVGGLLWITLALGSA
jgi:hypothetical protein